MIWLVYALLFLHGIHAAEPSGTELPDNFPIIGFSINPIYDSIGVRLGHVLTIRRERPILSTYEGEMMLGFGTGPGPVADRRCIYDLRKSKTERQAEEECFLFRNPARFSTLSTSVFNNISVIKDQPVVLYYIRYHIAPQHILMRTRMQALDGFSVQPDLKLPSSYDIPAWPSVQPEVGVVTGRIVQASLEFSVIKTYEVVIQESQHADNFTSMSVSDGGMFRYITQAMLTGKLLRIRYQRLWRPHSAVLSAFLNYMTDFRVISVEIVDNGSNQ